MSKNGSLRQGMLAVAGVALCALLLVGPGQARAQVVQCSSLDQYPCAIQLEEVSLQSVPEVFQFQARVSQAKLPVGEGVFSTVYVKILGPTGTLCMEQFSNVEVHGSVLNLSIGQNMSCELHEVIAENEDLSFQVCLGSAENCLKAIDLGSVPYAVKANFARVAQNAHQANQAAVSHYAHRLTADKQLWLTKKLGTGYFDFYTNPTKGQSWMTPGWEDGGFILWTPTRNPGGGRTVRIAARNHAKDEIVDLDLLVIRSDDVQMSGNLQVAINADIGANATVGGTLDVIDDVTVHAGNITVAGDADFGGHTKVGQSLTVATTITSGDSITSTNGGVSAALDGAFGGAVSAGGTLTAGDKLTVAAGGAQIAGGMTLAGGAQVAGGMNVTGAVKFIDVVTFEGGTIDTGAQAQMDELYLWTTGEYRDITFDGEMTFNGPAFFAGGITNPGGALVVGDDVEITGGVGVGGPMAVLGKLTVDDEIAATGTINTPTLDVYTINSRNGDYIDIKGYALFYNKLEAKLQALFKEVVTFEKQVSFVDPAPVDNTDYAYMRWEKLAGSVNRLFFKVGDDADDHMTFAASGGFWFDGRSRFMSPLEDPTGDLDLDDAVDVWGFLDAKANLGVYKIYALNGASGDSAFIDIMGSPQFYANSNFHEEVNFSKAVTGLTAWTANCSWHGGGCQNEGWGKGIEFIDRHKVDCPAYKVMTKDHWENCGGGVEHFIECCHVYVE